MEQQRLFDPGPEQPDKWRNSPEQWVKRNQEAGTLAYHASASTKLPRKDRGANHKPTEREVGASSYGGQAGLHLGTPAAAMERFVDIDNYNNAPHNLSEPTPNKVHAARLSSPKFTPKDHYGSSAANEVWGDKTANSLLPSTRDVIEQQVAEGSVIPYKNETEDFGSTSYRARPEAVRTWSEDVQADNNSAPALKHLAKKGYNVGFEATALKKSFNAKADPDQPTLSGDQFTPPSTGYADHRKYYNDNATPTLRKFT